MLKSTFLCEKRSPTCIRYGFHARAKAILHSVRTALQCKCFVQTCTMQEWNWKQKNNVVLLLGLSQNSVMNIQFYELRWPTLVHVTERWMIPRIKLTSVSQSSRIARILGWRNECLLKYSGSRQYLRSLCNIIDHTSFGSAQSSSGRGITFLTTGRKKLVNVKLADFVLSGISLLAVCSFKAFNCRWLLVSTLERPPILPSALQGACIDMWVLYKK